MKKQAIIVSFIFAYILGVTAYVLYHSSSSLLEEPAPELVRSEETILQAPSTRQQDQVTHPPPPRTAEIPISTPHQEPPRVLIDTTSEHLRQIERYLPDGAKVATYPVDETYLRAALTRIDLNGDGIIETIVVHTQRPPTAEESPPQLFLSVLSPEAEGLKVRSSARLVEGGVLFNIDVGVAATPLSVQDLTGDIHPEIIVASGIGASLGGVLQVYSVEGLSLHRLANLGGHFFRLHNRDGKLSEVTARSRYEQETTTYQWNGRDFEQK